MAALQRIKAFTMMELTVALLISAIVIAITYTAFNLISKFYLDYQQKHEEMALLIRLDELFHKDFSRAEQINVKGEAYIFTTNSRTISYRFVPGVLLRTDAGTTDTFKVQLSQVKASFKGKTIVGDMGDPQMDIPLDEVLIDELSFQILYQKSLFPYHYYKQYSSQTLFNADYAVH